MHHLLLLLLLLMLLLFVDDDDIAVIYSQICNIQHPFLVFEETPPTFATHLWNANFYHTDIHF